MNCPTCRGEYYGILGERHEAKTGAGALARELSGEGRFAGRGLRTWTIDWNCAHLAAAGLGERNQTPFFSAAYLTPLVGGAGAATILDGLDAFVAAAAAELGRGEPCPTCGNLTFVHGNERYVRRAGPAFVAAASALLRLRTGRPLDPCFFDSEYYTDLSHEAGDERVEDYPFFTEGFLYPLLGKEDARTVLAFVHAIMRAVGADPWTIEA